LIFAEEDGVFDLMQPIVEVVAKTAICIWLVGKVVKHIGVVTERETKLRGEIFFFRVRIADVAMSA
jgi:hypothetical protein